MHYLDTILMTRDQTIIIYYLAYKLSASPIKHFSAL